MNHIVAGINQKGGVGKTTLMANLAAALAREFPTLLIDLDATSRSATWHFGIKREEISEIDSAFGLFNGGGGAMELKRIPPNLSIIPGSRALVDLDMVMANMAPKERVRILADNLEPYRNEFNFILLDCPPSLNLVTVNAMMAADCFIVPVFPEYLASEGVRDLLDTAMEAQQARGGKPRNLGMVLNRTDKRVKVTQEIIDQIRERHGNKVFTTEIPYSVKLQEAPSHGQTIFEYAPRSPARDAFERLTREFLWKTGMLMGEDVRNNPGLLELNPEGRK